MEDAFVARAEAAYPRFQSRVEHLIAAGVLPFIERPVTARYLRQVSDEAVKAQR